LGAAGRYTPPGSVSATPTVRKDSPVRSVPVGGGTAGMDDTGAAVVALAVVEVLVDAVGLEAGAVVAHPVQRAVAAARASRRRDMPTGYVPGTAPHVGRRVVPSHVGGRMGA